MTLEENDGWTIGKPTSSVWKAIATGLEGINTSIRDIPARPRLVDDTGQPVTDHLTEAIRSMPSKR